MIRAGAVSLGILLSLFIFSVNGMCGDEAMYVDIYNPDKAYNGTTLLPDHSDPENTRVVEIDMNGKIVWEYALPSQLKRYSNPGFDAELLPNGNILIVLPRKGIYEINRKGDVIWSHWDSKISHDADRLSNGNTIYVFGASDKMGDAQVKEVTPGGEAVWSWYAGDHFNTSEYKDIYDDGWTHTNAVTRLENGNTLISPRNFNRLVEIDPQGKVVDIIGEDFLEAQHDPEVLANGNILVANHGRPQEVLEIDRESGGIAWRFVMPERRTWPVRDVNRLPNGNTLITGSTVILEVTPEKEIVWRVRMADGIVSSPREAAARGFYKAQRIGGQV
ncbi:MAG: aryl-sulfate sulfotransferase [Candidatus Omnitrophica bacterium]|nr:aryl-sulfate sulfotransferase [Candidatus Omnitrophota bacterium]